MYVFKILLCSSLERENLVQLFREKNYFVLCTFELAIENNNFCGHQPSFHSQQRGTAAVPLQRKKPGAKLTENIPPSTSSIPS